MEKNQDDDDYSLNDHEERSSGFNLYIDLTKAILMRWDRVIMEMGLYRKYAFGGAEGHIQNLASSLFELYLTIINAIQDDKDKELAKQIEEVLFSPDVREYIDYFKVFSMLSGWLYEKRIIKPDPQKVYDSTRVEIANRNQGL